VQGDPVFMQKTETIIERSEEDATPQEDDRN
jgi:hypothetical protein